MICPFCETKNEIGDTCYACGHPLVDSAMVRRGTIIASRYVILGLLGQGGMGTVYRAQDQTLEDAVALKVLRPEISSEPDLVRRFRQEIRLARRVRHRNVCGIHEYVEDGALRCIAMELVEGIDLKQILRQRGGLPAAEAFGLSIQAADGLDAIHDVGVVHRDLKTGNMMRDARGYLRLMDFGIAKETRQDVTATGQVVGTPEYISPEQARGEPVDVRSDLYALGVVIFEIFTGQVPFHGETPMATVLSHLHDPPPLEGALGLRLPPDLVPLLRRALAKIPAQRFQSAREMAEALRSVSGTIRMVANYSTPTPLPSPMSMPTPTPSAFDASSATVPFGGGAGLGGDLKTMGLPVVLQWIATGGKTGTLQIDSRSIQKRVSFRGGKVCSSWSNDPRESLGQFLVRDGRISEEQLFNALLRQEQQGDLLGTILVKEGTLTEEHLRDTMRAKAEATLFELFLWPEGHFEFREDDGQGNVPITLSLSIAEVLKEGQRRQADWTRIRKLIPSNHVVFRRREGGEPIDDARELQVFALAAAGKTPEEISLDLRLSDFDVCAHLYALCAGRNLVVEQVIEQPQTAETLRAIRDLLSIAEQRLREDRYDQALDAYENVLALDRLNQQAKKGLVAVFEARQRARARKTVPINSIPRLLVPLESLTLARIDPQEAFIVSRVNGRWDIGSILKLCPMTQEDALTAFARLLSRRILSLEP